MNTKTIFPVWLADFYKLSHMPVYNNLGMTGCYANFTPRSVKYLQTEEGVDDKVVVFGYTYFIKHILIEAFNNDFFSKPLEEVKLKFNRLINNCLGKGSVSFEHFEKLHKLGYLPISIRALDEGATVDARIPVITIENTHADFFWLPNYLETIMSAMVWKMMVNATLARKYRIVLERYARITGAPLDFVKFQGHDFSFRGMSGLQDACMSGVSHLTSFVGTDTIPAIEFAEQYYNADIEKELVGCSVPATEHSCMMAGTATDGELDTYRKIITEVYPTGIVSIVSDTYDYFGVLTKFMPALKDQIMKRDGKVVIRPDSGDPVKIVVGDADAPVGSPEYKGSIELLWEVFGGTINDKGFKVLDPHIGLIYGDACTLKRVKEILNGLAEKGFASCNIVFGIGSYSYNFSTRDTIGGAVKATAVTIDGKDIAIYKDPKTDSGTKKSAKGYLLVLKNKDNNYVLVDNVTREQSLQGELKEVFRDGKLLVDTNLRDIRNRISGSI